MLPASDKANGPPGSDKTNRFALLFRTLDGSIIFPSIPFKRKGSPPGPDIIVDSDLLCHYDMLPFEQQHEIVNQIGTTRSQIISNLNDLAAGTVGI